MTRHISKPIFQLLQSMPHFDEITNHSNHYPGRATFSTVERLLFLQELLTDETFCLCYIATVLKPGAKFMVPSKKGKPVSKRSPTPGSSRSNRGSWHIKELRRLRLQLIRKNSLTRVHSRSNLLWSKTRVISAAQDLYELFRNVDKVRRILSKGRDAFDPSTSRRVKEQYHALKETYPYLWNSNGTYRLIGDILEWRLRLDLSQFCGSNRRVKVSIASVKMMILRKRR